MRKLLKAVDGWASRGRSHRPHLIFNGRYRRCSRRHHRLRRRSQHADRRTDGKVLHSATHLPGNWHGDSRAGQRQAGGPLRDCVFFVFKLNLTNRISINWRVQTRKSPARRIGTPIPGRMGKRPVSRFPIPGQIGNRGNGNWGFPGLGACGRSKVAAVMLHG